MQIYLPVHQAAGHQEVFDGVNAFGFYYQVIVFYIKHFVIMLNGEIRDPHFFRRRGDVDMYAKEVSVQNLSLIHI